MKTYKVYFEIGGKKMKCEVRAHNTLHAQNQVKDKIIFHKTERVKDNSVTELFSNFLNIFKLK